MNRGAKIFIFSISAFSVVAFLIAFFVLNISTLTSLRNNETSNVENTKNETSKDYDINNIKSANNSNNIEAPTKQIVIAQTYTEISNYKTTIYDKEKNRIHNISLASDKLDETIVKAGEEFSFNETIGPMGAKEGYKKATGFNGNGKKIKMYGGGLCQLSSTLYNAALDAGLEITERHAHSRRVYYVPKNKDATVSYGGADLKFKNNTNKNIRISSKTDGHTVTIKIEKAG